jgi:hypothetical protein
VEIMAVTHSGLTTEAFATSMVISKCSNIRQPDQARAWKQSSISLMPSANLAYDRKSRVGKLDKALDEANANGWVVVDMKTDWKTVFPPVQ